MTNYKLDLRNITTVVALGISRVFTYRLILCFIISLVLIIPLNAQLSNQEIDHLKTKLEEAFIQDIIILSTATLESTDKLPKHVLVRGYTMPSNYFQIRFPIDDWNTKLFVYGCGMGCGTLPTNISGKLEKALQRGYATATMNSGHWGENIMDLTWAFNNRQAEKDYAYRAVHETIRATKALTKVFYDREALHSYFWGCSNGGRQGVMTAARYPDDFDGIISEAPAVDYSGWAMLAAWYRQANTGSDGKDILLKEDISMISKAVYDSCDGVDGKNDYLITDPSKCQFDPEGLYCEDEEECLSREKVEVLKKWYEGPVNARGERLLTTGISLGSEIFWGFWFLGESNEIFDEFTPSEEVFQYLFFEDDPGASYSVFDFDFDSDPEKLKFMGNLLNVNHLSLNSFNKEGGKLLMYHGLADPMVPYKFSVEYFEKIMMEYGEETIDFFRLFLVPGMDHCTALPNLGITAESLDPLTALEGWVEKDNPPQVMEITQFNDDGTTKSQFSIPFYNRTK